MSFEKSYLGGLRAAVGPAPLIAVGVRIMVEDDAGRFLVLRRADNGAWGLPAGAMELDESLVDAARRELAEETGLIRVDLTPFCLSSDPRAERHVYPNGDVTQSVSLLFHAHHTGEAPIARDGESTELRFMSEAEIDPLTFSAPEYPAFGHLRRWRETGAFQVV